MRELRTVFVALIVSALLLMISAWDYRQSDLIGPIPQKPNYEDSSQWHIQDRHAPVDLFYIISTETGDHLMGGDTCHFADTRDACQRSQMFKEMHAVPV